jgi:acetyl-CoA carboxylase biotin carboxyl carrier protein
MAKSRAKETEKRVRELAALLDDTNLNEIEVEEDGIRVRVARNSAALGTAAPVPAPASPATAANETPEPTLLSTDNHPGAVKSPMVGTAFVSPEPGAKPFVNVGDKVLAGQTVLIIEAMKVMNQIQAPKAGTVIEILVSNADPIEYDQTLMIIE